jgi:D-sedoheptulose 7-phosphate isomerase
MRPIDLDERRAKREAARRRELPSSLPRAELIRLLQSYLRKMREAVDALLIGEVARVAEEMLRARAAGKTVYVLGNGGSAATASHAATDWLKPRHDDDQGGLRAVSLVDNVSLLTAWANDTSFDNVFAAQLESLLTPGDLVIAVSGSGNSSNVLRAVETARRRGAITVGLSGFEGGALAGLVDVSVVVPCDQQGMVEDVHMMIVHALTVALCQAAPVEIDEPADTGRTLAV